MRLVDLCIQKVYYIRNFTAWHIFLTDLHQFSQISCLYFFLLVCGGTYQGRQGTISSPNYPSFYFAKANCLYKIVVPRGLRVSVRFQDFSIEPAGAGAGRGICDDINRELK